MSGCAVRLPALPLKERSNIFGKIPFFRLLFTPFQFLVEFKLAVITLFGAADVIKNDTPWKLMARGQSRDCEICLLCGGADLPVNPRKSDITEKRRRGELRRGGWISSLSVSSVHLFLLRPGFSHQAETVI